MALTTYPDQETVLREYRRKLDLLRTPEQNQEIRNELTSKLMLILSARLKECELAKAS